MNITLNVPQSPNRTSKPSITGTPGFKTPAKIKMVNSPRSNAKLQKQLESLIGAAIMNNATLIEKNERLK